MKVIIWNKEDIKHLSDQQKEMWFDIYNNDLFEDRGYDITNMDIEEIEELYRRFKIDYLEYLSSLPEDDSFIFYILLEDEYGKYVSQARVITKKNRYVIEGLETHRDFMKKGNAITLINKLEIEASKRGIKEIYANSYYKNIPSIKTFSRCGYHEIEAKIENRICMMKRLSN